MGGSALGGLFNDGMGIITDAQMAYEQNQDRQKLRAAGAKFNERGELDPESLKIAAEQMGLPPEVLASQYRNDQINALRQMQNIASQGGMDNSAIAANQQAGAQAARQLQSERGAQQNKLQMQGMNPGSGAALAQGAQAAQASYNTMANVGAENAAAAQMRALQAINSAGRLSGDIASADESRRQQAYNSQFERDRFNTGIRDAANRHNANAALTGFNANNQLAKDKVGVAGQVTTGGSASRQQEAGYMKDIGNRGQNAMDIMDSAGGGSSGGGFDPKKMFGGGK